MSRGELERVVRQHGNDLEAIYELLGALGSKIDGVEERLTARLDGHDAQFVAVAARFDAVDSRFDRVDEVLAEILRRLPEAG